MSQYTLEIDFKGTFTTDNPILEFWTDGVLNTVQITSSNTEKLTLTIPYSGDFPSSLEFRFNDNSSEPNRKIDIQSVKINDKYVNTSNYLSSDSLNNGESSSLSFSEASHLFIDTPDASLFTVGATHSFTSGSDNYSRFNDTDDKIFNMLDSNDYAHTGKGDDKISGGFGNDTLRGDDGDDLIFGDEGTDRIFGMNDNDTLYGGGGDDLIFGEAGNDSIHGGDGDDKLNGHEGNDILTGGNGNDTLSAAEGDDVLYGDAGNDRLTGGEGNDTLDGGAGVDLLYGGFGDDVINGGSGNDSVLGGLGADIIHGNEGNDTLYGNDDDDFVHDGIGFNSLFGGDGFDTAVYDLDWGDYIISNISNGLNVYNILTREDDNVREFESFQFNNITKTVAEVINERPIITSASGGDTALIMIAENISNVVTVTASDIESTNLSYSISGGVDASSFNIDATSGVLSFVNANNYGAPEDLNRDNIYDVEVMVTDEGGLTDKQTLIVEKTNISELDVGANFLTAGVLALGETVTYEVDSADDNDWFSVNLVGGTDYVAWARGADTGFGDDGDPVINSLNDFLGFQMHVGNDNGGIGNDALLEFSVGGSGTYYLDVGGSIVGQNISLSLFEAGNVISASGSVTGTNNSDYLSGSISNDVLFGGDGNDLLEGLSGDDTLSGGNGRDVLYGGDGADSFIFLATSQTDSVVDFKVSDNDILDFSDIVTNFDPSNIDDAITDYIRFTEAGDETVVTIDTDGLYNGVAFNEVAVLEGVSGEDVKTLHDSGNIIV